MASPLESEDIEMKDEQNVKNNENQSLYFNFGQSLSLTGIA